MHQQQVVIVGAGPAGLAAAACLKFHSIAHIILAREDCFASVWKKYSYDRLHLHLPKQLCELPHMKMPSSYPEYVPKTQFLHYLDDYANRFNINPLYQRCVECASFDIAENKWIVKAKNLISEDIEEYAARFLVLATGENQDSFIPKVDGLETFTGDVYHSNKFKSGKDYKDKKVLVVGFGNSGMEIALDMANHGANTSIVIRSRIHILSRKILGNGLKMLKYLPYHIVDWTLSMLGKIVYGDLTKYGIIRPEEGPILTKDKYGKYPIVDVGTIKKIKSGEIKVLPAITSIEGNDVLFQNGQSYSVDTIVFATGFRRSTNTWLKEPREDSLLNEDGFPRKDFPDHWKGKNGVYCVGLARMGLYGICSDTLNIAMFAYYSFYKCPNNL